MADRTLKTLKLDYWVSESGDDGDAPHVTVLGDPGEVRIGVGKSFINITDNSLSLSGGFPSKINIQGLSGSMKYAGMLQDSPFPLSLLPSTTFTTFTKQLISPPFLPILPDVVKIASLTTAFIL